jgi:hypothetical protein
VPEPLLCSVSVSRATPRHGHLDEAVHPGIAAFGYDRTTEASLLSQPAGLGQVLSVRYPGEQLAGNAHERYLDAQAALPKARSDRPAQVRLPRFRQPSRQRREPGRARPGLSGEARTGPGVTSGLREVPQGRP